MIAANLFCILPVYFKICFQISRKGKTYFVFLLVTVEIDQGYIGIKIEEIEFGGEIAGLTLIVVIIDLRGRRHIDEIELQIFQISFEAFVVAIVNHDITFIGILRLCRIFWPVQEGGRVKKVSCSPFEGFFTYIYGVIDRECIVCIELVGCKTVFIKIIYLGISGRECSDEFKIIFIVRETKQCFIQKSILVIVISLQECIER